MTSQDLRLEIEVAAAGWLNATIRYGGQELAMRASDMSDALGTLASAVVAISGETVQLRKRSVVWAREPDYWRFDSPGKMITLRSLLPMLTRTTRTVRMPFSTPGAS